MEITFSLIFIASIIGCTVYVSILNKFSTADSANVARAVTGLLALDSFLALAGIFFCCGSRSVRLMLDLSFVYVPVAVMSFSVCRIRRTSLFLAFFACANSVLFGTHLLARFGVLPSIPPEFLAILTSVALGGTALVFLSGLIVTITNLHIIMKAADVWTYLKLCRDGVLSLSVMMCLAAFWIMTALAGKVQVVPCILMNLVLTVGICFEYIKMSRGGVFLLLGKYENLILESLVQTDGELLNDPNSSDPDNKTLFDQLTSYFEKDKPFLRCDLSIDDVSHDIYTNKLYISRAVNMCTGRNFRQFVNYYRVKHSIDMFHENPNLKIVEIYNASGFNSMSCYNAAFKLFMKETPGEWFRMERVRMKPSKNKKKQNKF